MSSAALIADQPNGQIRFQWFRPGALKGIVPKEQSSA